MHHVAFLVEAHTLYRQKVGQFEVSKGGGFTENVIDNFVLYHFEIDNPRNKRERRLVLFIKWLHLEQGAKGVLLFTLVKLFVKTEFLLTREDAVWVRERLRAINRFTHRIDVLAETCYLL